MKHFLFAAVIFISLQSKAGTFVGNGGEGVEVNGQLFLRDLFSFGNHQSPYLGKKKDSFLTIQANTVFPFAVNSELLQRKLNDIETKWPGVGFYLLEAIKSYNWSMVNEPLTPIANPDDQEDPVQLPQGTQVYQIANRFQMNIRINREAWSHLDEANQVALLIHEVVYGYVRPSCDSETDCHQKAYLAREIVGLFFSEKVFDGTPGNFTRLSSVLSIPSVRLPYSVSHKNRSWRVTVRERNFVLSLKNPKEGEASVFARHVCQYVRELEKQGGGEIGFSLQSVLERRPYELSVETYNVASEGTVRKQQYTKASIRSQLNNVQYHPFTSFGACEEAMAKQLPLVD